MAEGAGSDSLFDSQDELELEPDDSQLHPDYSGDELFTSVQENAAQEMMIPYLPEFDTSDDMEYQEQLLEDEELIVLDTEHPLALNLQAALKGHITKRLDDLDQELREMRGRVNEEENETHKRRIEVSRMQRDLTSAKAKLDDSHHRKIQAKAKHPQAEDELVAMKKKMVNVASQYSKVKAKESLLQQEIDKLMQQLIYMQSAIEEQQSHTKIMQNIRGKAGTEKKQAEEQKFKQDLYVEKLTKRLEHLAEEMATTGTQNTDQAKVTKETKEALAEVEMELTTLFIERKQLQQQWTNSLLDLQRKDEKLSEMQKTIHDANQKLILLLKGIEGDDKCIAEEQDNGVRLTTELSYTQMGCTNIMDLISAKKAEQEVLRGQIGTCLKNLTKQDQSLASMKKEANAYQSKLYNASRHLEREGAMHLELEERIVTQMQEALTHSKDTKYLQKHVSQITKLKKDKVTQLSQLENDLAGMKLECSKAKKHLITWTLIHEDQNEKLAVSNKSLASKQAMVVSFYTRIKQKQHHITILKQKIDDIVAATGHEDLGPFKIKEHALMAEIVATEERIKSDKQLWMKMQDLILGLMQQRDECTKGILKLQTEQTAFQQRKTRLERQIEAELREKKELEKSTKVLIGDLQKLNTQLNKMERQSLALEQDNALLETFVHHTLKDAERESIEMQVKLEESQVEKERLLIGVMEAELFMKEWERKLQLLKETRSTVESGQEDIQLMKSDIHNMERRYKELIRERALMQKDGVTTVERFMDHCHQATKARTQKQTSKQAVNLNAQHLMRKIRDTNKIAAEYDVVIRKLQEEKEAMNKRLAVQKHQLIEHCRTNDNLGHEIAKKKDAKERGIHTLHALQQQSKMLEEVRKGTFRPVAKVETVDSLLQSKIELVNTVHRLLQRKCKEYPPYKEQLRRMLLSLEACIQNLETPVT